MIGDVYQWTDKWSGDEKSIWIVLSEKIGLQLYDSSLKGGEFHYKSHDLIDCEVWEKVCY